MCAHRFGLRSRLRRLIAAVCATVVLVVPAAPRAAQDELLVFAAVSLTDVMDAVVARFQEETNITIKAAYASSSTLAWQIEQGAPADVYVSAHPQWINYLEERGLLDAGSRTDLLGNELVLIAPRDSTIELAIVPDFPLTAALGDGRLAMGDPDHVPAGIYGRAALEALGVWPAVEGRVIRADNVRLALALVARGEAPLGIVYRSDALAEKGVRIVGVFPAGSHPPIVYPAALTAAARQPAAGEFLVFLRSPAAASLFARYGFTVIR